MTVESVSDDFYSETADWAIRTGIWDGRTITVEEASQLQEAIGRKIAELLFSSESFALQIAALGSVDREQIDHLKVLDDGSIIPAGFGKTISKFWKQHKTEILIGVAVVVVVTVAAVIYVSTAGAAAPAIAAGSTAALGALLPQEEEKIPSKPIPGASPPPYRGDVEYVKDGFLLDGKFFSYQEMRDQLLFESLKTEESSWARGFFEQLGEEILSPELYDPDCPLSNLSNTALLQETKVADLLPEYSRCGPYFPTVTKPLQITEKSVQEPASSMRFKVEGKGNPNIKIMGINGIDTTFEQAQSHGEYTSRLAGGHEVEWVYNKTHTPLTDIGEVFALNFAGSSPNTAAQTTDAWREFHEQHKDSPKAKIFQECHSQGAIHIRNALQSVPKEIRDRVIVVAIAPAAVIPDDLCFKAYNYASKKDLIPYVELLYAKGCESTDSDDIPEYTREVKRLQEKIIWLEPHPDASTLDHEFQSPTYSRVLRDHIVEYINNNGEYQ